MINGGIHGHSIKIGVKTRFSLKLVNGAKEFNEYLLNNIKSFLSVPYNPIGNSIQLLMVLIEDLFQCLLISLLTSGDQLGLINIHGALTFLDEGKA
jgi:mannose/fructose/N-acetylgalactosamine-specific phosphotransferase system component IID